MNLNGKILSWAYVIIWLGLIFSFSHQPASESKKLSTGVTQSVVETVEKVAPKKKLNNTTLNHTIRKNAHFFLYFVLGLLMVNAIIKQSWYSYKSIIAGLSFLCCVLYATSDEIHQLFVLGRGAQMGDVYIDSAGSALGIALYMMVYSIKIKK